MNNDVTRSLYGRLVLDRYTPVSVPIFARLRYCPDDPMAVRLSIPTAVSHDGGEVEWVFARELLNTGMHGPSGDGDVRIRPGDPGRTVIEFVSRQGSALIEFRNEGLRQFLHWAYCAVPDGQEAEHLDLDAAIAQVLDDA